MTEEYRCLRCGQYLRYCRCPEPVDSDQLALRAIYIDLRRDCIALEELVERASTDGSLTDDDLKRLDKAVTVMKVAFKIAKKVLRAHGAKDLKTWREAALSTQLPAGREAIMTGTTGAQE